MTDIELKTIRSFLNHCQSSSHNMTLFHFNYIDNGLRINQNVSSSNIFHLTLALFFLIKLTA